MESRILAALIEGSDPYGPELVLNGTFDTDTAWSKLNSTISGGLGNLDGTGVVSLLYQNILTDTKTYKVDFDVSNYNSTGSCRVIDNGGTMLYNITSNGPHSFTFIQDEPASGNFIFRADTGGIYSVDNVSVKEVL